MSNNPYAMTPVKKPRGCLKTLGWIVVALIALVFMASVFGNTADTSGGLANRSAGNRSAGAVALPSATPRPRATATPTLTPQQIRESAAPVTFEELARYPERHEGRLVSVKGEVIQSLESWGVTNLRVNITQNEYGWWEDTILVYWDDPGVVDPAAGRILEGDIVAIYGVAQGLTSYESVLGATITLPQIEVRNIVRIESE